MNIENIGHCIGVIVWLTISIIVAFIGMTLNKVNIMGVGLIITILTCLWYLTTLPSLFKKS